MTKHVLNEHGLNIMFREARTFSAWTGQAVTDMLLRSVYDLMKLGPTSANCCPGRFIFVMSKEAKERLKPHLADGNVEKTMAAPVTAIIANDLGFYEHLPMLFPQTDAKAWYKDNDALIRETAFRNGTLQGAYLMMAARAMGLDCGPMSGFNAQGVKNEFLAEQNMEVNFLCNIGHGNRAKLLPRNPRFHFHEACKIF